MEGDGAVEERLGRERGARHAPPSLRGREETLSDVLSWQGDGTSSAMSILCSHYSTCVLMTCARMY